MSGPEGTIRAEAEEDRAVIADLLADAFGGTEEVRLVERLRAEHPDRYGPSLVAEVDGHVVGFVALSAVELGARRLFALAPVAVLPAFQGMGIGAALVARVMELVDVPIVVLGEPAYYRRFGFEPALPLGLRSPWDDAGEAWMIRLPEGEDRRRWAGTVRYPPPFEEV